MPDASAIARWMHDTVAGFQGPLTLSVLGGGQSNPTYRLDTPHARHVLRKKPDGPVLPSAHAVDREFRVMSALAGTGVPVPRMVALCTDPSVIGTMFYVMEYVEGRVFLDPLLPGLAPAERAAMFDALNATIATLHGVDATAVGLGDFGRRGGYLARQVQRWTAQYRAAQTIDIPAMEHLIAWLPTAIPTDDESAIVHGDFRLDNCVFHPTEPRILAVLDWELSTIGHPLADFAYHAMAWLFTPDLFRGLAGADLDRLGIPRLEPYVEAYCRRTGRALPLAHWTVFLAFNMFRFAAILQGIAARAAAGNAAAADARETGLKAAPVAELGWAIAHRADRWGDTR